VKKIQTLLVIKKIYEIAFTPTSCECPGQDWMWLYSRSNIYYYYDLWWSNSQI